MSSTGLFLFTSADEGPAAKKRMTETAENSSMVRRTITENISMIDNALQVPPPHNLAFAMKCGVPSPARLEEIAQLRI